MRTGVMILHTYDKAVMGTNIKCKYEHIQQKSMGKTWNLSGNFSNGEHCCCQVAAKDHSAFGGDRNLGKTLQNSPRHLH